MALLNDITIGRYQPRDSLIHRLDPRTKGFCVLAFMAGSFAVDSFTGLIIFIVITLGIAALAKVNMRDFTRNLKVFIWLFALTFLLHLFFSPPGEVYILPYLGWRINLTGLENGFYYTLRIALLLAYSYLFMAVTSPLEIADGLERALKPLQKIGFPAQETAMVLSIALRFVPTLLDEARRIKDAQICRGARLDGGLIWKVKGFSAMLIPLFVSALRRADNLALALEARGYRSGEVRTSYVELKVKVKDLAAIIIVTLLIAGLIII